jgi:hypothetical protein
MLQLMPAACTEAAHTSAIAANTTKSRLPNILFYNVGRSWDEGAVKLLNNLATSKWSLGLSVALAVWVAALGDCEA